MLTIEDINHNAQCFKRQMERFKKYISEEDADSLRDMLTDTREQRLKMGSIRTVKK